MSPPQTATPPGSPLYNNIPDTFGSAHSRLSIQDNRLQFFRALPRLPTTSSQSLSPAVNTRPRYQNAVTFSRGSSYSSKALSGLSFRSASASRRLSRSDPLAQLAVAGCHPFSACRGTRMSHRVHCWWGRFPSSIMTTVYRTCRFRKCTRIAVRVAAWPGQLYRPPLDEKAIRDFRGPSPVAGVLQLRRYFATPPC